MSKLGKINLGIWFSEMIYIYLPRIDESGLARGLKYCRNWCLMVQRYKNYQTLCIVSSFRWDYFLDAKFHQLFLLSYSRFLAMCSAQVDLVTMLEKAISYVKFLQLQVKVKTKNNITSFPLKTIELKLINFFASIFWCRCWQPMNFGRPKVGKHLIYPR